MKKITFFITIIVATLTSHAQFGDCGLINLSATGTPGNNYSFQVGSNVDSLVASGLISSNNVQQNTTYIDWVLCSRLATDVIHPC